MENIEFMDGIKVTSRYGSLLDKTGHISSETVIPKEIEKEKISETSQQKIDRTYTKRRRISKKNLQYKSFKKDEVAWAMWIERDGSEKMKVKTRPLLESDLKRSSDDFRDSHEVISAFLMVVLADSLKQKNRTSVMPIDNQVTNLNQRSGCLYHAKSKKSMLSNVYLHRYSTYDPAFVLTAVYTSIERFMKRPDYQKYYSGLLNQNKLVDHFFSSKIQTRYLNTPKEEEYPRKELKANGDIDVGGPTGSDEAPQLKNNRMSKCGKQALHSRTKKRNWKLSNISYNALQKLSSDKNAKENSNTYRKRKLSAHYDTSAPDPDRGCEGNIPILDEAPNQEDCSRTLLNTILQPYNVEKRKINLCNIDETKLFSKSEENISVPLLHRELNCISFPKDEIIPSDKEQMVLVMTSPIKIDINTRVDDEVQNETKLKKVAKLIIQSKSECNINETTLSKSSSKKTGIYMQSLLQIDTGVEKNSHCYSSILNKRKAPSYKKSFSQNVSPVNKGKTSALMDNGSNLLVTTKAHVNEIFMESDEYKNAIKDASSIVRNQQHQFQEELIYPENTNDKIRPHDINTGENMSTQSKLDIIHNLAQSPTEYHPKYFKSKKGSLEKTNEMRSKIISPNASIVNNEDTSNKRQTRACFGNGVTNTNKLVCVKSCSDKHIHTQIKKIQILKKMTQKNASIPLCTVKTRSAIKMEQRKDVATAITSPIVANEDCLIDNLHSSAQRITRPRKAVDYRRLSMEGMSSQNVKFSRGAKKTYQKLSASFSTKENRKSKQKGKPKKSGKSNQLSISLDHGLQGWNQKEKEYIQALQGKIIPPSDIVFSEDAPKIFPELFALSNNDELPDIEDDDLCYIQSALSSNLNTDTMDQSEIRTNEKRASSVPRHNKEKNTNKTICRSNAKRHVNANGTNRKKGMTVASKHEHGRRSNLREHTKMENNTSSKSRRKIVTRKCKSKNESTSQRKSEESTLTLDHRIKYPVSNDEFLKYLSEEETSLFLTCILKGEIKSERHDIVSKMFRSGKLDFGIHSEIFHLAGSTFLEDDGKIDAQLFEAMNRILEAVDLSHMHGMSKRPNDTINSLSHQYSHHYIYHVLVPEGIVQYLQYKNSWDKKTAETFYQDGESRISELELQEFDEELDEDAKRKRSRMLQEQYDTSDESEEEMCMNGDEIHDLPNIDNPEIREAEISEALAKTEPIEKTSAKAEKHNKKYKSNVSEG